MPNRNTTKKFQAIYYPNIHWQRKEFHILDELQMLEINNALVQAIRDNRTVEVKYYTHRNYKIAVGKIIDVDNILQLFQLKDSDTVNIHMDNVVWVKIL